MKINVVRAFESKVGEKLFDLGGERSRDVEETEKGRNPSGDKATASNFDGMTKDCPPSFSYLGSQQSISILLKRVTFLHSFFTASTEFDVNNDFDGIVKEDDVGAEGCWEDVDWEDVGLIGISLVKEKRKPIEPPCVN